MDYHKIGKFLFPPIATLWKPRRAQSHCRSGLAGSSRSFTNDKRLQRYYY